MELELSKRACCALMVVVSFVSLHAQHPDVNRIQSAQLPAPAWLKASIDQGVNDPRLKGYLTPAGLKLEIVADYPTVVNPVGMTFDDHGTAHVLEWLPSPGDEWTEVKVPFTYKDGSVRQVAAMKKKVLDVVKVLSDTKNKGVYDQAKVVLQEQLPSSILIHDGWLYVSGRGSVRRYRQSIPGGVYDTKEVIAKGFCGFHHHQVSGLTIGNDGRLYMTSGDDDNVVEGSDGSRATVFRTGAVFRSELDGSKMELFARGLRNPYRDVAFDSQHNMFHADNDNEDGTKFTGCRLIHMAEGADFGWRLNPGARCCTADTARGAAFGEMPGKMQPMLKTGRGAPAGLLIYNEAQFPKNYRDLLFYPDVFRKVVRGYAVAPDGATFKVTHEFELIKSEDPLFRPNQMVTGPDGAIYIVDWRTDSGGAGRLFGDGKHGRIYRLTWSGTKDEPALLRRPMNSWAILPHATDLHLVAQLSGENETIRARAQRELASRGKTDLLVQVAADSQKSIAARLAALGGLQKKWTRQIQEAVVGLLKDADPAVRRLAVEAIALNADRGDDAVQKALQPRLLDADLKVKRAAVLAVAKVGGRQAQDAIAKAFSLLSEGQAADRYLADAFVRAFEIGEAAGMDKLVALAESGDDKTKKRALHSAFGLRTRESAVAIAKLLEISAAPAERVALLRAFTNIQVEPPVEVLKPVLSFFRRHASEPTEVKLAGLEILGTTASLSGQEAADFLLALVDDADSLLQHAALKAAEQSGIHLLSAELMKRVNGKYSPDVRAAMVRTLRSFRNRLVLPLLPALMQPSEGMDLRLEAFRSYAELDPKAAEEVAKKFLFVKEVGLQTEAAAVLGRTAVGAKYLGQAYVDKKLPSLMMSPVTDALTKFKDTDPAIKTLWNIVDKDGLVLSLEPDEVARWKALSLSRGDAIRGRAVYLNSSLVTCSSCHRLEGIGGNVGPDLTRVWDTQSFEKLMESIVEPSREIKEGYQSYTIQTIAGQSLSGLKLKEDDKEVVIKEADGKVTRVLKADIDELKASAKSLMPDASVRKLSDKQFIDLMAFLRSRSAQESIRAIGLEFWVAGPFSDKTTEEFVDVKNAKLGAAWKSVRTEPTGSLNFRALYNADNISAYALTRLYSPKAQKATLLLGSDDGARVWLNGVPDARHGRF